MLYRDGSLSSFPSSVDTFTILNPLDLELANHFNKLFDSCIKLEEYLFGRVGNKIQSVYGKLQGGTTIPASATLTSYYETTQDVPTTGLEFTVPIPAEFGTDPLLDPRFGVMWSVELIVNGEVVGSSKNMDLGVGLYTILFNQEKVFVSVGPDNLDYGTLRISVKGDGFDGWEIPYLPDYVTRFELPSTHWQRMSTTNQVARVVRRTLWRAIDLPGRRLGKGGYLLTRYKTGSVDQFVYAKPNPTLLYLQDKVSIGVRMSESNGLLTGYLLDFRDSGTQRVQLYKYVNENYWSSGTGTLLADIENINQNKFYRISASGTTISVDSSSDASSWTNLTSVVDSSISSGYHGFAYNLLYDNSLAELAEFKAGVMNPSQSLFSVRIKLLMSKMGEDGKIEVNIPLLAPSAP